MNLDRKVRMQERTIQSLRDKNKKLESENKACAYSISYNPIAKVVIA